MNPAQALLVDHFTPAFMWACVAALALGILTAKIIRAWDKAKAATTPEALAKIIDGPPADDSWVAYIYKLSAGHDEVYDQEMHQDGDLAKWEKEIRG